MIGLAVKIGLGTLLTAAALGTAATMWGNFQDAVPAPGPDPTPIQRRAAKAPGMALDGVETTTDLLDSNNTTKSIAQETPVYQSAKQATGIRKTVEDVATVLWAFLRVVFSISVVVGTIALITRTIDRRKRTYRVYELRGHREESVSTEQVRSLMSSWFNLMFVRRRRLTRLFKGAPSMTLRMLSVPDPRKDRNQLGVYIQVPAGVGLEEIFDHGFTDAYQDAQLLEVDSYPDFAEHIVRLKKTRMIPYVLRVSATSKASDSIMEGFNSPITDRVAATMASRRKPCELQYVMTAAPRPFDRLIYWLSKGKYGSKMNNDPIETREGQTTAEANASEPHAFCEIRVGSTDYQFARDTAAAFAGAAGGDAQLRERRPVLRRKLYKGRFHKGVGNPIPGWLTSVMSSSEMASVWALPSTGLRSISIKRSNKRRIETPPEVWYPKNPKFGMFQDMRGKPIALREEDAILGTRFLGLQGMGKTAAMIAATASIAAQNPRKAIMVADLNKDLAEGVMAAIAPNRKIHYIDIADPICGFDPFSHPSNDFEAITNVIVQGLIDVSMTDSGESQILASSQDFIVNATMASLATTLDFGFKPSFHHLQKWVETGDNSLAWQADLNASVIARRPDLHNTYSGIAHFHNQISKSESQFTARAGAPYNKFRLLSGPTVDKVLRHPHSVDIQEVIENGEILVISGANHEEAYTVFRLVMQMVHQALGRLEIKYKDVEPTKRPSLLFSVDEAGPILTATTAKMIAQRRSAGLSFMAGLQHDSQIADPSVRESVSSLLQNTFQFRTGEVDARARVNQFQVSYDDQYDSRLRQVRDMRISPASIMNLPKFNFYAATTAYGERIAAFTGSTLEPKANRDWVKAHIDDEISAGGGHVKTLTAPKLDEQKRMVMNRMLGSPPTIPEVTDPDTFVGGMPSTASADGPIELEERESVAPVHPDFQTDLTPKDLETPQGTNGNGNGHGSGSNGNGNERPDPDREEEGTPHDPDERTVPEPGDSALDREIAFTPKDALDDLSVVSNEAAGFDTQGEKKKRGTPLRKVSALGQHVPGEMTLLLENVDELRNLPNGTPVKYEEPQKKPSTSAQHKNAQAENFANDSRIFPQEWNHVLGWLYEFNYLSNQQIAVLTGRAENTVTTRMRKWMNDAGAVRGVTLAGRKFWTLTDMGARIGRQMVGRNGPMIPLDPSKGGKRGQHEAKRIWKPRNLNDAQAVVHDLHLASWVLQWVLLCDGDFRVVTSQQSGIIKRVRGEFSSQLDSPTVRKNRKDVPMGVRDLVAAADSLAFDGLDFDLEKFGALRPDAVINMHNLAPQDPDPKKGQREIWIELDRAGHYGKLRDKLRRLDEFLGGWWRVLPRYTSAGRPPSVLFIAPDEKVLRRQLAIADETLRVRSGPVRQSANDWDEPLARKRIYFALESDLHKGSTRAYQVPEERPSVRVANATTDREKAEAEMCVPIILESFLPARLMAGRREGTNEPGPH